ncbi:MAG TPA: YceI family protein [Saprospiraceae bacterium]|nr:YceI family protein [Saprospiraceae bacterium]
MKQYCLALLILFVASSLVAQSSLSRNGTISFFSDAPLEKIEAHNRQVISTIDAQEGTLDFAILIKAFQFEKALMKKQFNEDYLHSDRYPKANFKGHIIDLNKIDLNKNGNYPVTVTGVLFLHGVNQRVTEKGRVQVENGKITNVKSTFSINLGDYHIKIPLILKDKIADTIQIEVDVDFNGE